MGKIKVMAGGGSGNIKKSFILSTNPTFTTSGSSHTSKTLIWTTPTTEMPIDYYNIYYSTTQPTQLSDMTFFNKTSDLTIEVTGLSDNTLYYFAVESVGTNGYENASMWKVTTGFVGTPVVVFLQYENEDHKTYYSTDMSIMTFSKSFGESGWTIGYGNGVFVALPQYASSFSNTIYYSIDGITWNYKSQSEAVNASTIAYGNGRFIALGNYGTYYSTDGITWLTLTTSGSDSYKIAFVNNYFWKYGFNSGFSYRKSLFYKSSDGTSWTKVGETSWYVHALTLAYTNGVYVSTGYYNGGYSSYNCAYYSTDGGATWKSATGSFGDSVTYQGLTVVNNVFYWAYDGMKIYSSEDGATWTLVYQTTLSQIRFGYYNKLFFLSGSVSGSQKNYKSADCITWTEFGNNVITRQYASNV